MDVLLAHGYYLEEDAHERKIMKPHPPLGILYLSAYLKRRGFSVSVFDSTFRRPEEFSDQLEQERPSVVGLYCNLMTKLRVLSMVQAAKGAGARVVLGGPEPPFYAEEYLSHGADVIVVGEGEETMEELVRELSTGSPHRLSHVRSIVFRNEEGRVERTPPRPMIADLDSLPMPDRDAIDLEAYLDAWRRHHGYGSVSLICARGCPYHCDWCSHSVYGKTHRRRSPEGVADEVELIQERYRPDQLWYADDVFTIKPSWTVAFARELSKREIRLPFECISRADRLNEELVETLTRMGCFRIWIGSESGSQRILDAMGRGVRAEQVRAVTRLCQRHGIEVGMFLMVGYEGETEEDLKATVEHLKEASPDIVLTTVAYPIKGTGYYDKVSDRLLARTDWESRTDRDLTIAGRHSRRYYESAMRWMVNEARFHKELQSPSKNLTGLARLMKSGGNWARGRLGMALTRREMET